MTNSPPLEGINVLSFEHAIAAPLCTRQLAELGARVIKIERRDVGDFSRHYDDRVKGQSSHFIWTNRSKQSLTLDIKHELSREILKRLVGISDVIVQNLAPNAMERLGLSYATLKRQHEKLIVCNISGYGANGPYKNKKAYDLLVQAEAGFLSVTGTEEQMVKAGISVADTAAGMQAFAAILAAIIQRGKTGKGSCIEISMLEAMVEWMGFPLFYAYDGAPPPTRSGADHASIYPYGVFKTSDDKVILVGLQHEREWEVFCRFVLEQPNLIDDDRFATNANRSENREELKDIIQSLFSLLSAEQIATKLDGAQIAYANVNNMDAVWKHPQLDALNRLVETSTPTGAISSFKPPTNNSEFEASLSAVPALGEHTRDILQELDFSAEEIEDFYKQDVI
ncbi:MAG: CaiB/BaiF CoA-transferase family protein [Gammaproteobacteria bacterium]|nr:CaiB/BaiF CoA-transferase family protein [Gammaproteobacteria bacterium]MDD9960006.1 CaiB/BaiF CoA-transferase family protein [Gammaproteobacteria bacterium]